MSLLTSLLSTLRFLKEPVSGYAPDYAIYRTALARFAYWQNWSLRKELHPH